LDDWHVYMIRCRDGTLYTGVATDVDRRFAQHREARGPSAKYLRGRGPLELVLRHEVGDRGLALRVERRIKRLPKARKERLVTQSDLVARLIDDAR
jgi:putative endonuclease